MDGDQMEEEDDEGSPEGDIQNNVQGVMSTDDYEEIDYKICGELGKCQLIV